MPLPPILKLIVSSPALLLASVIACLNDPAPEASVFVTVNVCDGTSMTVSSTFWTYECLGMAAQPASPTKTPNTPRHLRLIFWLFLIIFTSQELLRGVKQSRPFSFVFVSFGMSLVRRREASVADKHLRRGLPSDLYRRNGLFLVAPHRNTSLECDADDINSSSGQSPVKFGKFRKSHRESGGTPFF
jgi:hypothetical protein